MQVQTTARHFELDDATREHAEDKLRRLSRYFDQIQDASVTITKEKFRYSTEITLTSGGRANFASHEETNDLMASIDGAIHALESQIKRHKGRLIDRREKREGAGEAFASVEADTDLDDEASED